MSRSTRILIVDDDHMMAKTLVDILTIKNFEAEAAFSGPEALDKVKNGGFDCVLTDIKMPGMNGVELYRSIAAVQPDLPVVLMTAYAACHPVNEALQEGAIAILHKPLDINILLSFVAAIRKERYVVIVDNNPMFCKTTADILQSRNFAVTSVCNPYEWERHLKSDGQIVLLDMKLNDTSGLDILKQIKQKYPHLTVIMVTGHREETALAMKQAMEDGADICLPLQIEELIRILIDLQHQALGRILSQSIEI